MVKMIICIGGVLGIIVLAVGPVALFEWRQARRFRRR